MEWGGVSQRSSVLFSSLRLSCAANRWSFEETQDGDDNGALWVACRVVSTSLLRVINNLREQPYTSCQGLYYTWSCVVGRAQQGEHLLLRRCEAKQATEAVHPRTR